jgi:hypothetical protein
VNVSQAARLLIFVCCLLYQGGLYIPNSSLQFPKPSQTMMTSMNVHASISETDLATTPLSADDLAKAIQIALRDLKHPVNGAPIVWPAPIRVVVEGNGPETRPY